MDASPITTLRLKPRIKRLKRKKGRSIQPDDNYENDSDIEKYSSSPRHIHITHLHQDELRSVPDNNTAGHQVKTEVLTERFRILRGNPQETRGSVSNSNGELVNNGKKQTSQNAIGVSRITQHESPTPIKHNTKRRRSHGEYLTELGRVRVNHNVPPSDSGAGRSSPMDAPQGPSHETDAITVHLNQNTFPSDLPYLHKRPKANKEHVVVHHFKKPVELEFTPANNTQGHEVKTEVLPDRFHILRNESQRDGAASLDDELKQTSRNANRVSPAAQHGSPMTTAKHKTKKHRSHSEYLTAIGRVRVGHNDSPSGPSSSYSPPMNNAPPMVAPQNGAIAVHLNQNTFPTGSPQMHKTSRINREGLTKQEHVAVHHFKKHDELKSTPANNTQGHEVKTEVLTEQARALRNESQRRRAASLNDEKKQTSKNTISVSRITQHESPMTTAKHKNKKHRSHNEYLTTIGRVRISHNGAPSGPSGTYNPPTNNAPPRASGQNVAIAVHDVKEEELPTATTTGYNNTLINEWRFSPSHQKTTLLVQKKYRQFLRTSTAVRDDNETKSKQAVETRSSIDSFTSEEVRSLYGSNIDIRFPKVNNAYHIKLFYALRILGKNQ